MLNTIFYFLFICCHYFFIQAEILFCNKKLLKIITVLLCFIIYYLLFGRITDTTDWTGYEFIFDNDDFQIDFMFRFLSSQTKLLNLSFVELYQFHVFLTALLLIFFITRFTSNLFFVLTFTILILFIPLANQIRFFLSLSLFLNAIYFLFIERKFFLFFLLCCLSILNHIGILLLVLFIPLFRIKNDKTFLKTLILLSIFILIITNIFFSIGSILDDLRLNAYITDNYKSSFLGALYYNLPVLIFVYYIFKKRQQIVFKIRQHRDKKLYLLYRFTLFSFIFIPASFLTQILLFRYCISVFFVWLLLNIKIDNYLKINEKISHSTFQFLFLWSYIIYIYFIPTLILNSNDSIEKVKLILNSIN